MAVEETVWGEVDGRTISFPMVVPEINAATLMFTVPYDAAEALLPPGRFEVLETAPGVAQLVIALCDYRQNPWGDYDEINLGFLARPKGAPDSETGSFVMGLPKTVEQIEFRYTDETVQVHLVFDGKPTLQVTFPRVPGVGEPAAVSSESYGYLDGVPYSTTLEMEMGTGIIDPEDVVLTLGEGVVADELRSLGLPTVPDLATWGEGLRGVFLLPQRVGV
jgi:hypothetical protein